MNIKEELGLTCGGKCTGACCQVMFLPLANLDAAKWAACHDQRVFRIRQTGEYRVLFKKACAKLTEDKKCQLFDTFERPKMCGDFWCQDMPDYDEVFLCPK